MADLCLHTPRADCNHLQPVKSTKSRNFASTRSVQIATSSCQSCHVILVFASTRSVQIATFFLLSDFEVYALCLHTLRADCNLLFVLRRDYIGIFASTRSVQIATCDIIVSVKGRYTLPPHAPCRLQPIPDGSSFRRTTFASTRSVQIATFTGMAGDGLALLCLHTLRADCNGRNAQNCNMHFSERVLSW